MNAAKPIRPEEYKSFHDELYEFNKQFGRDTIRYEVPLDPDPTLQPKSINEKLARVQAFKDRVVAILNRAILSESYWKAALTRLDSRLEAEYNRAMVTEEVRGAKSAELRQALATGAAKVKVAQALLGDSLGEQAQPDPRPVFDDRRAAAATNHADALAFLKEVQNIYDNLHSTDQNLSRQLKSVMVNAKVYDGVHDEGRMTLGVHGS